MLLFLILMAVIPAHPRRQIDEPHHSLVAYGPLYWDMTQKDAEHVLQTKLKIPDNAFSQGRFTFTFPFYRESYRTPFAPFAEHFERCTLGFTPISGGKHLYEDEHLNFIDFYSLLTLDGSAFDAADPHPDCEVWDSVASKLADLFGPPDDEGQDAEASDHSYLDGEGSFDRWQMWELSDRTIRLSENYMQLSRHSKYQPFPERKVWQHLVIRYKHDPAYRETEDHLSPDWRPVHDAHTAAQEKGDPPALKAEDAESLPLQKHLQNKPPADVAELRPFSVPLRRMEHRVVTLPQSNSSVVAKESPKKARQRSDLTSQELSRILNRTFEDKNGKTLDAYVVSVTGSSATLNSYGTVRKFEVKFFSKYNKEYLISGRCQLHQDAKIKAFLERERLMSK
jgi:hypothetical protein